MQVLSELKISMANPNNIIRPSAFSSNERPVPSERHDLPEQHRVDMSVEQLTALIGQTVAQVLPGLIKQMNNNTLDFTDVSDQVVEPEYRNNLADFDRVPDIVKSIREFSGNPAEFGSWKKSVDRIMETYTPFVGTPKYYGILHTIRNKIVGSADVALESYSIPLDWKAMSRCLTLHYADKRDITTLEYQMSTLVQGHQQSVEDFHQDVYKNLSLILNKVGCMQMSRESEHFVTKMYREKALDTFIRGLRGDLPRLLAIKEPADLPSALHYCLKLENQTFRSNHAANKGQQSSFRGNEKPIPAPRNFQPSNAFGHRQPPPVPPRHPMRRPPQYLGQPFPAPRQHVSNFGNAPFIPPRQNYQQQWQQYNAPPRPFATKPQPRPEPMDVDGSVQTRNINYMNRPHSDINKRQKNYNIQTVNMRQPSIEVTGSSSSMTGYQRSMQDYETQNNINGTLNEYCDGQIDNLDSEQRDHVLHFLE